MFSVNKRGSIVLLVFILALLIIPSVHAQNILDDVFGSLFRNLDVAGFYNRNSSVIDFILLAIIFIGLSMFAFKDRFGPTGKPVAVAVGIALTFAIMVWMTSRDYSLAKFGVIAGLILIGVLAVGLFELLKALGASGYVATSFTYILIYTVFKAIDFGVFSWLGKNAPIVLGLLALAYAGAVVIFIWAVIDMVGKFFGELASKSSHGIPVASTEHHHPERRDMRDYEQDLGTLRNEADRTAREQHQHQVLNEAIYNLENIQRRLQSNEAADLQGLANILRDLAHTDSLIAHIARTGGS